MPYMIAVSLEMSDEPSICVRQYGVHALRFLVIDYGGKSIEE
jgi:hypothetical protein